MTPQKKQASPQQKTMFDSVMLNVRKMLYNDTGMKTAVDKIKTAEGGPATGIAHTSAMMLKAVEGGISEQGRAIPPEVMMGALKETVGDVTEVAVAANVVPPDQKAAMAQQALPMSAKFMRPQQEAPQPGAAPAQPEAQGQVDGIINKAMGAV